MNQTERKAIQTFLHEFNDVPLDWFEWMSDSTMRLMLKDVEDYIGVGWRYAMGYPLQEVLSDELLSEPV